MEILVNSITFASSYIEMCKKSIDEMHKKTDIKTVDGTKSDNT